jgi:hypothetical protein
MPTLAQSPRGALVQAVSRRWTVKVAKMKKPRDVIQPRWGVYALRKKAERIGSVDARDEKEAVRRAFNPRRHAIMASIS